MEKLVTETYVKYTLPGVAPTATCIVVDLDDTIARYCKVRRLSRCHEFDPMPEVLDKVLDCQRRGVSVVIATARPAWTCDKTFDWLQNHGVVASAVYFRNPRAQSVPPHEVKRQMLLDILTQWRVERFWDDSMLNCLAVRDLGVPVTWVEGNESYWLARSEREGWSVPTDWRAILKGESVPM